MQSNKANQSIFIIAGMHRSGTSLAASILQSMGVDVGQRLMGAYDGNVKGYFEDLNFVEFHQSVLHSQGISADGWTVKEEIQVQEQYLDKAKLIIQNNLSKPVWGWKDPRTTLFLSFWAELLPNGNFLFVYRSPWEVVDSLYRRGIKNDEIFCFNPNFAIQLWINYNQAILDFYKQFPEKCLLFNLGSITRDPTVIAKAIEQKFKLILSPPDLSIYDKSFLHTIESSSHRPALIKHFFSEALALYDELNTNAFKLDGSSNSPWFELTKLPPYEVWALQDWLDIRRLGKQQSTLKTELERSQAQLQQTQVELERSQAQLQRTQQDRDDEIARLSGEVEARDRHIIKLESGILKRDHRIEKLESEVLVHSEDVTSLKSEIAKIQASTSWKIISRLRILDLSARRIVKFFYWLVTFQLPRKLGEQKRTIYPTIAQSKLFNADYYLRTYPDVAAAGIDPLKHFIHYYHEGRNPNPNFDTNFYLRIYPDIAGANINPLLHYILFGRNEGRQTK